MKTDNVKKHVCLIMKNKCTQLLNKKNGINCGFGIEIHFFFPNVHHNFDSFQF